MGRRTIMKRASGERWVNHLTDCGELERVARCWWVCGRRRRGALQQGKVTWPYQAGGGDRDSPETDWDECDSLTPLTSFYSVRGGSCTASLAQLAYPYWQVPGRPEQWRINISSSVPGFLIDFLCDLRGLLFAMSLYFLICKMGDNKSHGFADLLERVKQKMCMR